MEIFWLVDDVTRIKLMQFQYDCFHSRLPIARDKPPWEQPVTPVINAPDHEELEEMATAREMSQAPVGQRRVA